MNASVEETFGMTTVEAMYCRTPSIVSDCSALPEIIGNNGFVVMNFDILNLKNIIYKLDSSQMIMQNLNYSSKDTYRNYLFLFIGENYENIVHN